MTWTPPPPFKGEEHSNGRKQDGPAGALTAWLCHSGGVEQPLKDRGSTMNVTTYGLDLAKRVFQVHWIETDTGEVKRKTLRRTELCAFFAGRPGS